MQVAFHRTVASVVFLSVLGLVGCDAVPPTENPAMGLTNDQRLVSSRRSRPSSTWARPCSSRSRSRAIAETWRSGS